MKSAAVNQVYLKSEPPHPPSDVVCAFGSKKHVSVRALDDEGVASAPFEFSYVCHVDQR